MVKDRYEVTNKCIDVAVGFVDAFQICPNMLQQSIAIIRGVEASSETTQAISVLWMYTDTQKTVLDMIYTQSIHKRMARFQKLTINLFLPLHGRNVHRQQRQLSKFRKRDQQFTLFMLTAGPRGQFPIWRRGRKMLTVCSVQF
jgi:hypothetical protein